jgi:hypothetical protein
VRTFRQIPRISGVDKNLVKILEPMRDAIEQLIVGEGRALRIPDIGTGLAFKTNKLVALTAAAAQSGGVSQEAIDDLLAQFNALIASQQQFRSFVEQQLNNISVIATDVNALELDANGYVTGISGNDVPGDAVEEVPFIIQTDRFGIVRPAAEFEVGATYVLGEFVIPSESADVSTGLIYEVTVAGVAAAEPDWLTANDPGETVTSGAVTFTARTPQVPQPFAVGRIENVPSPGIDGDELLDHSVPDRALQPYTRTHVVLQPEESDDKTIILGERGLPGADGASLLVVFQPEDVDDPLPIPGERGLQGAEGPTGSSLPVVLQPEDPDDAMPLPGERGVQGEIGAQGSMPPPVVLQPEDPDEQMPLPGERGPAGADGTTGGGASVVLPCDIDYEETVPWQPTMDPAYLGIVEQLFRGRQFFDHDIITGTPRTGQLNIVGRDSNFGVTRINWFDERAAQPVDQRRWGVVTGFGVWGVQAYDDAGTTLKSAINFVRPSSGGVAILAANYGNSTDLPLHTFHGIVNIPGATSQFTGRGSVPAGGAAGQQLTKNSATDYDVVWGAAGGGGGSATVIEQNLGSVPVHAGRFAIADAAITPTSKIFIEQAPGIYTGKGGTLSDEGSMDPMWVQAYPNGAGNAIVQWRTIAGMSPRYSSHRVERSNAAILTTGSAGDVRTGADAPPMGVVGRVKGNFKFQYMVLS